MRDSGKAMTQTERVEWYMREFGSIDQSQALQDLGIWRLASRISDLRRRGLRIAKRMKKVTNRYGESSHVAVYSIEEE